MSIQLIILYDPKTIKTISNKITELLEGVHPEGKKIVVTDRVIGATLTSMYNDTRPNIGDIYDVYNIPHASPRNDLSSIINRTIELITNNIRT